MNEIQENGIKIYNGETDEDDEDNPEIKELKVQPHPSHTIHLSPSTVATLYCTFTLYCVCECTMYQSVYRRRSFPLLWWAAILCWR